jgi:hypothetical protein
MKERQTYLPPPLPVNRKSVSTPLPYADDDSTEIDLTDDSVVAVWDDLSDASQEAAQAVQRVRRSFRAMKAVEDRTENVSKLEQELKELRIKVGNMRLDVDRLYELEDSRTNWPLIFSSFVIVGLCITMFLKCG